MEHLTLVGNAKTKTPRRARASAPDIPCQVSRALKQLESGVVDFVCVVAASKSTNSVFQYSAGLGAGSLSQLNKPFINSAPPDRCGNLITLKPRPSDADQITAIARAYMTGQLDKLHLLFRPIDGKVVHKVLEQKQDLAKK